MSVSTSWYPRTGMKLWTADPRMTNSNIVVYTIKYRQWPKIRCEGFRRSLCRPASEYSKADAAETLRPTFALLYLGIHCMSLHTRRIAFSKTTRIDGGLELLRRHHHVELHRRAISDICSTVKSSITSSCNWLSPPSSSGWSALAFSCHQNLLR